MQHAGPGPRALVYRAAPHHVRDLTFREDAAASSTGGGPANLATIHAAVIAAVKDVGYLHIPKAAATTPPQPKSQPSRPRLG